MLAELDRAWFFRVFAETMTGVFSIGAMIRLPE